MNQINYKAMEKTIDRETKIFMLQVLKQGYAIGI
jgi:hypothetical protein